MSLLLVDDDDFHRMTKRERNDKELTERVFWLFHTRFLIFLMPMLWICFIAAFAILAFSAELFPVLASAMDEHFWSYLVLTAIAVFITYQQLYWRWAASSIKR